MRYVQKQTWSNFLIFHFLCDLEFFTQKQKHKSKIKSKNNAYKKNARCTNAWGYSIQCMKSPIKIEKIRSRTNQAKAQSQDQTPISSFSFQRLMFKELLDRKGNVRRYIRSSLRMYQDQSRLLARNSWQAWRSIYNNQKYIFTFHAHSIYVHT